MIHHIQLKVSTADRMANGNRSDQNRIKAVLGYRQIVELRHDLHKLKQKGFETIPAEGCEHDGKGNCPGHESKANQ